MKRKDFDAINEAMLRIATKQDVTETEREELLVKGVIMGLMMWLAKYYDENKEDLQ